MKKTQDDSQATFPENAEALWEHFEKTGSVQAYLRYSKKVEKIEELVPLNSPS
jgi:hypothetical protein